MSESKADRLARQRAWFKGLGTGPEARAYCIALQLTRQAELAREKRGWSYSALAREMGVSPAYTSRLLQGHENSTLLTLVKLGDALGLELEVRYKPRKKLPDSTRSLELQPAPLAGGVQSLPLIRRRRNASDSDPVLPLAACPPGQD
jgi:transcriptional regulator with XRE-family HTH domain